MAIRVLILDDEPLFGQSLVRSLALCDDPPVEAVYVTTAADAVAEASEADRAGAPFDIFLIDQRLGPGPDGVEVLTELLAVSPRSDAIVFTVAGDQEAGLRAYQAGAYRYLHKPFRADELVIALKILQRLRETRLERDWLRVIAGIAKAAQRLLSLEEVQREIVLSGPRLEFERTRLWLYDADKGEMVCVDYEGRHGEESLINFRFPATDSPYMRLLLDADGPKVFRAQDEGRSYLVERFEANGYRAPVGDWVGLPLRTSAGLLGVLMLDNHDHARSIPRDQLDALAVFGDQVVVALERAQLHEREQRQSREIAVMAEIGRLISDMAATHPLEELLEEIYRKVGDLMRMDDCFIALHNQETGLLDLRLEVEYGQRRRQQSLKPRVGLVSWVVDQSRPLLLAGRVAVEQFTHAERLWRKGHQAACFLGVPLTLESETVGAICVQSYDDEHAYTEEDQRLLAAVAAQVAGAINTARLSETADIDRKRLNTLVDAGRDLISLASEDEERFWHLVLTISTAGYAIGFNRAMLLLLSPDRSALVGRLGIGHLKSGKEREAWRKDEARGFGLESYRALMRSGIPDPSDLHGEVLQLSLPLADHEPFATALRERRRIALERQTIDQLPTGFVQIFGRHPYAILPIYAGEKRFGVLVVDNAATGTPLLASRLDQLETWLAQAALAYENRRQHDASEQLVLSMPDLLAHAASQPLQSTLNAVCQMALALTAADNAMIYPLAPDGEQFDMGRIGLAGGLLHPFEYQEPPDLTPDELRATGPDELRVLPDIDLQRLDERQRFIRREQLRASLAVPLYLPVSGALVGLLYLNYRNPQRFTPQEQNLARNLARLSAAMIGTSRTVSLARDKERRREYELSLLSEVLKQSLRPDIKQDALTRALLDAARNLLSVTEWQVGLILREWKQPTQLDDPAQAVRRKIFYLPGLAAPQETFDDHLYTGITGKALIEREDQLVYDVDKEPRYRPRFPNNPATPMRTRSELDVLIKLDGQILGVFNIESPVVGAFTAEHHERLRRLADVAALALDNLQRREHQRNVLQASSDVVAESTVDKTLQAILQATRRAAPDVDAVTIWRVDEERGLLIPGPNFGVSELSNLQPYRVGADHVLSRVLNATESIWADDAANSPLQGHFVAREQIASVAAFPLRAASERVGVLFFNYRTAHRFSSYEKVLLETFATLVAGALRDALHLDQVRRERERLAAIRRVAEAVGPTLDLEGTLRKIFSALRDLFQARNKPLNIAVLLFDGPTRLLNFHTISREFYDVKREKELPLLSIHKDKSIACRVARDAIRHNRVVFANVGNVSKDGDYMPVNANTQSEFCLALVGTEAGNDGRYQLLGLFVLESDKLHAFDDDEKLLLGVGKTISVAIERVITARKLQLDSAIAAATVWVHEVAHEINSEIGDIRVAVSTMLDDGYLSAKFHEPLLAIDASAERLRQAALDPRTLNPEPLLLERWLARSARRTLPPSIRLEITFDDARIEVLAVEVLLERAVSHLLRNARDAMRGADDTPHGLVRISVQRVGAMAVMAIENDGSPIPEHLRERLLVERVSTKGTPRSGQRGMGLLFVRYAIEAMRGSVRLVSLKEPVTFELALPLSPASAPIALVPRGSYI